MDNGRVAGRRVAGAGAGGGAGASVPGGGGEPGGGGAPDGGGDLAAVPGLPELDRRVSGCRACPRLVAWREEVARVKRAAFRDQDYWGRPVPGFGGGDARLAVVGLAPAAHGGNRTGRMFTGDASGEVLYAAMHAVGLANQPEAVSRDDGLRLLGARITAPVKCAPPDNKPTPAERDTCRPWLERELTLLRPTLRAVVVLGGFGWQSLLPALTAHWTVPSPRPRFAHGARVELPASDGGPPLVLHGCYHVSRRNTQTGLLTVAMVEEVLSRAKADAGLGAEPGAGSPG
ncbi:uracil-DNA glycosylase [Actinosynnema pretiosum]|uniref:Type-5 uracil-DNA glycosylase n=1 Tax=Actinosynnema pretiosum TaxID=42197 RepID=A0A290Z0A6_9PSEU|nr:uracil-DNA glycosylase [Actinosynnema pretiosum]